MSRTDDQSTEMSIDTEEQESFTMLTFEDLRSEIDLAESRAGVKESWDLLRKVLDGMAGEPPSPSTTDLVTGRHWALTRVEIQNFRGVSNSPSFTANFSPLPGITVLHGPNGAGKSSISDAISLALTGTLPKASDERAGKLPLWEPIALARGSSSAKVCVTLQDGSSLLHCTATIDSSDNIDWKCELEEDSHRTPVKVNSLWANALSNHQPVFAYATLERKIQLSRHLAEFFENLLALGGTFSALETEIDTKSKNAQDALDTWNRSFASLKKSIDDLEVDYSGDSRFTPIPLTKPSVDAHIDQWARANNLLEEGKPGSEITGADWSCIQESAENTKRSLSRFEEAGPSSQQGLLSPLKDLHESALRTKDTDSDDVCPVCGTVGKNWRHKLEGLISSLSEMSQFSSNAAHATDALNDAVQENLVSALRITIEGSDRGELEREARRGLLLSDTLGQEIKQHGASSHHNVLTAAQALADWLESPGTSVLMEHVVAQSDRLRAWRLTRSRIAAGFLALWHRNQEEAAQAQEWKSAKRRVEDLRRRLRERRTEVLERRTNKQVQALLADVGLEIKSVKVQKTKAELELADPTGKQLELGMLSAGQRNAMLLAPLLASVDAGPFSFLVLDDPVHAFDRIRVDRLARSLAEFAKTRRVIVMTHDERLREHLMARAQDCDVRTVDRDPITGAVTLKQTDMFWKQLLEDAKNALEVGNTVGRSNLVLTDVVRGLCRQALDNSMRDLVIRISVRTGSNPDSSLSILDKKYTTRKRLGSLESIVESAGIDPTPISNARSACEEYVEGWNRSAHGNKALSEATREEIDTVTSACSDLFGVLND